MNIENNFALSCRVGGTDPHQPQCPSYLFDENVEDNINFFDNPEAHSAAGTVSGNYIAGGHSATGSGIQCDEGADGQTVTNNIVLETADVGIAHSSGTNYTQPAATRSGATTRPRLQIWAPRPTTITTRSPSARAP